MKDTRVPESHCLACGYLLDAAASASSDETPTPGDISLCINCGHIMAFADDLHLRALTDGEMVEVAGRSDLLRMQMVIVKMHAE